MKDINQLSDFLQGKPSPKKKIKEAFGEFLERIEDADSYKGEKGENGKDGADGYTPIKGVDYFDGEDGYTPVKGIDYFDGEDGKKGDNGIDGTNGKDGKDGSPDTPKQIVDKLNTLEKVLEVKVLKDADKLFTKKEFDKFQNQVYTKGQIDQRWHGGGITSTVADNNYLRRDGTNSPTANIDWGAFNINNLADPTADQDAATKKYVDDSVSVENNWDRNATSGYLFPHTLTDRVGIGTNTPNALLTVNDPAGVNPFQIGSTTPKLIVTSAGNVGIGTATPGKELDVATSAGGGIRVYRADNATEGKIFFGNNNLSSIVGNGTYGLQFITSNAEKMRLNASGNLGIGTTAPLTKLHVAGTTASDYISTDTGFNINQVPDPTVAPTGVVSAGGSVNTGAHRYYVTYTTALGETHGKISAAITTTAGNNTVTLTIPTSTDPRVTGRKIYRNAADASASESYYLATIADNTTVTYVDTAADSTLTTGHYGGVFSPNSTDNGILVNGVKSAILDTYITAFGPGAGAANNGGFWNAFFGSGAGQNNTTGLGNSLFGYAAGGAITTGSNNVAFGSSALASVTGGSNNVAINRNALLVNNGSDNIAIGNGAGQNNTGSRNLFIGSNNGLQAVSSNNNIFLGFNAGQYETGSNSLIIDSLNRTTEALGRTSALIYGVANSTPASQILSLGGGGKVGIGTTTPNALLTVNDPAGVNPFQIGSTTPKLIVTSAGNVGIGTASPLSKLHISTGSSIDAGEIGMTFGGSVGANARTGQIIKNTTAPYEMTIRSGDFTGTSAGSDLKFQTNIGSGDRMIIQGGTGNVGIGTTAPTAVLHLKAGTATASTAPLKFTTGVLLTTPEAGTLEFVTDALYFTTTTGPTRHTVATIAQTQTLTNKRITKRVASTANDATSIIDCDTTDDYYLTAMSAATEISVTGTPTNGQEIFIALKDDGTTRGLTWTGITALGVTLPATTTPTKQHIIKIKYITSAWFAIAASVAA